MQIISAASAPVLTNSGVSSQQLLFPENAPDAQVTITRVTVPVGALSPRHSHDSCEQVWVVLEGAGTLLLGEQRTSPVTAGDVVRFPPGEIHGLSNTGTQPFVYLSVTTPPLNFRKAYAADWSQQAQAPGAAA